MSYVPNASDTTQPTEDKTVESAALEFRTLKADLKRSLKFPAADAAIYQGELPAAAARAGKFLWFNSVTGVPEAVAGTPASPVTSADIENGSVTPAKLSTGAPTWNNNGHVGIGVTPSAWESLQSVLQNKGGAISSGTSSELYMGQNSYYGAAADRYVTSGIPATSFGQSNGAFTWRVAPSGTAGNPISFTQAMKLDASGLFIGQTTNGPVNTNGFSLGITDRALVVNHASGVGSGTQYLGFGYGAAYIGSIAQNGTTGVLFNVTSDYRLKTVIGAVSGHGERIDALEPIEYAWKSDGSIARGFLAHKFQEVYPASVTGAKDAVDTEGNPVYQGVQASSAEAMADIFAELKSLRQRVAALEAA